MEQRLLIDPGWIRVDARSIRIDPDSITVRSIIDLRSITDRPPTACRSQVGPGSAQDKPNRPLVDPHRVRADTIAIRVEPLSTPGRPPTGWRSRKDPGSSMDQSRIGPGSAADCLSFVVDQGSTPDRPQLGGHRLDAESRSGSTIHDQAGSNPHDR
jgi:hypothetical protein